MSSLKRDVKKTARREARFLSRDPAHCRFMSRNKFAWLSILSFCADGDAAVRFERAASAMVQNQSESNGAVAGSSETGCSATDSSNAWAGSAVLQTRMPLDTTSGHQSGPSGPPPGTMRVDGGSWIEAGIHASPRGGPFFNSLRFGGILVTSDFSSFTVRWLYLCRPSGY